MVAFKGLGNPETTWQETGTKETTMTTIAATTKETVWKCDRCGELKSSPNAFTIPEGWWKVMVHRKTNDSTYKNGVIDTCSKECLLDALKYDNRRYVTNV